MRRWLLVRAVPIALILLYVAIVVFATGRLVAPHKDEVAYKATQYLPPNTRLRDEHVVRPADLPLGYFRAVPDWDKQLKDRYVRVAIEPGRPVHPDNVMRAPDLSVSQGALVTIPLKDRPDLSRVLNAEARVCIGGQSCLAPYARVRAVICDRADAKTGTSVCHAIVEVSEDEEKRIRGETKIDVLVRQLR